MAEIIPFPRRHGYEPWVSKKELARHLGYSTRWIELRHRDGLPHRKDGGRTKYQIGPVEAFLQERAS